MIGSSSRASSWLTWAQQPREQGGLGLAPHQAAGIVGNLTKESGDDLPSWGPTGDNGTAWGTAQWRNERLGALKQMYPDSYQTVESQQAFMRHELDTTHNKAYQALQSARTPEEAATAFNRLYEVSADNTGGREAAARQLMAQFGGSSDSPGALTSAFAPTESKSRMASPALSADETLGPGVLNTTEKPDNVYEGLMQMAASLSGISNPEQAKALTQQMVAGRKAQGTWTHQIMPNGQIMVSNSLGGMKVLGKPGDYSKDDTYVIDHSVDPTTGIQTSRVFNKNTGQFVDGGQGSSGAPQLPGTLEELQQQNPALAAQVVGVNEGRIPYPNASRLNPQQQMLKNAVSQYYPGVDATTYAGRQQYMKNLGTDQPSQPGGQFVGLGHSLDMARQLGEKYVGLGNNNIGFGIGHALNVTPDSFGGLGEYATSGERSAKLGALDENVDRLTTEIGRLFSGNQGGGIHEREATRARFSGDKTPTEAAEGLKSVRDMILSRKDELLSQADRLGIDRARIPGLDKLDSTINELNGHIDTLGGKKKATAAPAIDHSAIDAEMKRRGL